MIRWRNAPSFPEWRKRIDAIENANKSPHFDKAIGKIARNLCYCHIMAGKEQMARQEVLEFGGNFPANRVNSVFRMMAKNGLSWRLWYAFLRHREFHRNLHNG